MNMPAKKSRTSCWAPNARAAPITAADATRLQTGGPGGSRSRHPATPPRTTRVRGGPTKGGGRAQAGQGDPEAVRNHPPRHRPDDTDREQGKDLGDRPPVLGRL